MASIAFPGHAKSLVLSTGHTYSYVHIPPSNPAKPTILFLHGFPSSCYDWRHQIKFFPLHGYGILAPDLLGYGGTSKPASAEEYKAKKMATEMTEILDHERLTKVHAVSHDTGTILLSRLANYFPDRLLSCTFLAVPYSKPREHFDLDAVNAMTKTINGKERFGYLKFFISDDVGNILDQHSDSFFTLFYPRDPSIWNDHLGPEGAMEAWLLADRRAPMASYITDEERAMHQRIMQGHHGPPFNWYCVLVNNLNEQDEIEAKLCPAISCPTVMLFPGQVVGDFRDDAAESMGILGPLLFKYVSTPSHWLQLEARDEVNAILKDFFEKYNDGAQS